MSTQPWISANGGEPTTHWAQEQFGAESSICTLGGLGGNFQSGVADMVWVTPSAGPSSANAAGWWWFAASSNVSYVGDGQLRELQQRVAPLHRHFNMGAGQERRPWQHRNGPIHARSRK